MVHAVRRDGGVPAYDCLQNADLGNIPVLHLLLSCDFVSDKSVHGMLISVSLFSSGCLKRKRFLSKPWMSCFPVPHVTPDGGQRRFTLRMDCPPSIRCLERTIPTWSTRKRMRSITKVFEDCTIQCVVVNMQLALGFSISNAAKLRQMRDTGQTGMPSRVCDLGDIACDTETPPALVTKTGQAASMRVSAIRMRAIT
jgi:hypothetical protein